jgi:hypothetical protein
MFAGLVNSTVILNARICREALVTERNDGSAPGLANMPMSAHLILYVRGLLVWMVRPSAARRVCCSHTPRSSIKGCKDAGIYLAAELASAGPQRRDNSRSCVGAAWSVPNATARPC